MIHHRMQDMITSQEHLLKLTGEAHLFGDAIDTDRIIPGKYTKTLDLTELGAHIMEDLDPLFRTRMRKGDLIVAGTHFGCGSSREQAPLALKVAGISAVIAKSFARIFFRNAINVGLPVIEIPAHSIQQGDVLKVNLCEGRVENLTQRVSYICSPLPVVMLEILSAGGLVPFMRAGGSYEKKQ